MSLSFRAWRRRALKSVPASGVPPTAPRASAFDAVNPGDRELILGSGLFDRTFYLSRYRDVAAAGVDPATHYLEWGASEGRRPSPFFDGVWYLRKNPDAAQAGHNPLIHYLKYGSREGRRAQKRCVVYTAITQQYDDLRPPLVADPELDYIVFADDRLPDQLPDPWIRVALAPEYGTGSLASRYCKTHPHILLPGYEISAWVDGAFKLRNLSGDAMEAVSRDGPIAFFSHPERSCAYDEAKAVKALGRDSAENVDAFVARLQAQGFPSHAGLVEAGFIIRNHHDDRVVRAMEEWWEMIRNGSRRDQLSINFVLWKQGLRHVVLAGHSRRNQWAYFMGHRPATLDKAREELLRLEWELLELQTTIERMRGSLRERDERTLEPASARRSGKGNWDHDPV